MYDVGRRALSNEQALAITRHDESGIDPEDNENA